MARIAFFTERLPPDDTDPIAGFSYELMCSLADQQHEVRIISTYRERAALPPPRPRMQILRPFRKWGWLEIPRTIPSLLEFRPDVLHIIQPRAESLDGLTSAMSAIPGLVPPLGRPAVITSFYDLRQESLRKYRLLLATSDAVTVMNLPQRDLLERYYADPARARLPRRPTVAVLPAPQTTSYSASDTPEAEVLVGSGPSEALRLFAEANAKLVFLPGDISDHRDSERLFPLLASVLLKFPDAAIVFGGGWGSIPAVQRRSLMRSFDEVGSRVLITGPLSLENELWCLQNARVAFTASLPSESLSLTRILREALSTSTPLVMGRQQADYDPLPWQNRKHSFIADIGAWETALLDALQADEVLEDIRAELPEFSRLEAIDQPSNVMSRVYAQVLEGRRRRP